MGPTATRAKPKETPNGLACVQFAWRCNMQYLDGDKKRIQDNFGISQLALSASRVDHQFIICMPLENFHKCKLEEVRSITNVKIFATQ